MSSKTIASEPVVTHRPPVIGGDQFDFRTYLLGQLNDNVFGKIAAELYLKFQFSSSAAPTYQADKGNILFDSLVLSLQYDTSGTYANDKVEHKVELYQLLDKFVSNDTFYSDTNLATQSMPLFSKNVTVSVKDSVGYTDPISKKNKKLLPQLRLRLDDDFGKKLLMDSIASSKDSSFASFIKGFYIKSTPLNNPSLFGLNLSNSALATAGVNKLIMYYTVNDTVKKQYEYFINSTTINRFIHDQNGSQLSEFVNDITKGDSLTFLQGIGGVKTVISFDDLSFLKDKLINKAELEIFVADQGTLNGSYPAPLQIYASRKTVNGNIVVIPDISQYGNNQIAFGGVLEGTGILKKYTMNITNHIKTALFDDTYNSDLYIGLVAESQVPRRAILYGAKHSTFPMNLKVIYTKK
ncbi:MAG: DUF4270 family protein [Saprospiraceae bacterium]|nr:DUF4270 family protein [Saprospiraceae bacterium]